MKLSWFWIPIAVLLGPSSTLGCGVSNDLTGGIIEGDEPLDPACHLECDCANPAECAADECEVVCPTSVACGETICEAGFVCCNASCGICAPPDGACTDQVCQSE